MVSMTKKILYCFAGNSVFGYRDAEMLSQNYTVKICHYDLSGNLFLKGVHFIHYSLKVIWSLSIADVIIVNFGAWHTIFPVGMGKLARKKTIILLGGFDAGNIPSIRYGIFHKPSILQFLLRKVYRMATYLCPVSDALVSSINYYADPSGEGYQVGILHFIPDVRSKIKVIPTDYDQDFWMPDINLLRNGVIALAYIYNEKTYVLKGFDLLVECAKMLPEIPFTFAGFSPEMVEKTKPNIPANVKLLSFQTPEASKVLFQKHKIFVLPSLTEGLPNTLCEAMLCGCIPIVSNVGVMPDLVGKLGYVLDQKKPENLKILIRNAVLNENYEMKKIREKISMNYFKGIRLSKLQELINKEQ